MTRDLQARGYKLTAPRLAVLEAVASGEPHLTPAEVYEQGQALLPGLGLTTVYRTLEILARLGHLHRSYLNDSTVVYSRVENGHHGHLVCLACGRVVDFADCHMEELARELAEKTRFRIASHLLEFNGLCPDCDAADQAGPAEG